MARVLVIDDDPMVSRMLQEHLSNEGYEVATVLQAEEGFEMALKTPPDLILLDVNMPDATGFQMCGRFRKNPATESIPIIMITGTARWPNQQAIGRQMGANAYILKPFDVVQVGDRIHNLMGPKRPPQRQRIPAAAFESELRTENGVESPLRVETTGDAVDPPLSEQPPAAPSDELTFVSAASMLMDDSSSVTEETPLPPEPVQPEPIREPAAPVTTEEQRFFDFSAEILALVSRLPRTYAGSYVADQLLKSGTAVGAIIHESQWAGTKETSLTAKRTALKEIRTTGYWLMLIRKAALLPTVSIENLESQCQELTALLAKSVAAA